MKIWKTIIQQENKVLIVFDDMLAGMEANKKSSPIITELLIGRRKLNISLVLYHTLNSRSLNTKN